MMAPSGPQSGNSDLVGGPRPFLAPWRAPVYLGLIVLGAAVWRLPLLLRAERFFTSDEAIVGLMARRILAGDLPVFFWGQRYMGTVESYMAAGAFSILDDSVLVLKLVPLLVFLAFLLAHYDLASLLGGREEALLSVLLLAVGTPVLYSWSARAMAGYMETLLLGTLLLSTIVRYERAPSRRLLFMAGVVAGAGWWTSRLVACFVLAGAAWLFRDWLRRVRIPRWVDIRSWIALRSVGSAMPRVLRDLLVGMNIVATAYLALAALVLATGGGELRLGPLYAKATDGWKLAGYAGCWLVVEAVFVAAVVRPATVLAAVRGYGLAAAGFMIGYAPALYGWLEVGGSSAQLHKFSLPELLARLPVLFGDILPLMAGGSLPEGLNRSWITTAILLGLLLPVVAHSLRERPDRISDFGIRIPDFPKRRRCSVPNSQFEIRNPKWGTPSPQMLHMAHRQHLVARAALTRLTALPALTAAFTIALFLFSGNFSDLNSYRYLLPIYAPMSMLYAHGIGRCRSAAVKMVLVLPLLFIWGVQDDRYVRSLEPDRDTGSIVQWLRSSDVEFGYADYWIAYRLDFISGENPLLAPYKSQDRYPRYTEMARSADVAAYVIRVGDPIWPKFLRAKRRLIREQALIGRHRVYLVSRR